MAKHATLKIHSLGGIRTTDAAELLSVIDDTYNSIYAYDSYLDSTQRLGRRAGPFYLDAFGFPFHWETRLRQLREWPPKPEALRTMVSPRDRLILRSVELHSPGFWEFLGSLNPLEVLRKYLGDAHERRKDREYREDAEKRKLDLENKLREAQVLQKEIDIAKSIGATDQDFAPLRNALVYEPLRRLQNYQRRDLIDGTDEIDPHPE
ncbi:MAG TPA: hypothetical protein VG843_04065 [Rhizomicrobium sp.]|jgi:hypothetical protein|nr:hypothetical protein [Rhizomicrobium sp.]